MIQLELFPDMNLHYILNDKHEIIPASFREWGEFFEKIENRRVAQTTLEGVCWVSTIFMGLDHSFALGNGPPILFETMVFSSEKCEDPGEVFSHTFDRYATWAEAEVGHMEIVESCQHIVEELKANAESVTAEAFMRALRDRTT